MHECAKLFETLYHIKSLRLNLYFYWLKTLWCTCNAMVAENSNVVVGMLFTYVVFFVVVVFLSFHILRMDLVILILFYRWK